MLSQNIKKFSVQEKIQGLDADLFQIKCKTTMSHIKDLVYTKTQYHKVKCMSFDMNWCITKEFQVVTCAIFKISSVLFALRNYMTQSSKQDSNVKIVLLRILEIYHHIKEGLREYGCKRPEFTTGTFLKKDDILTSATLICNTWLQ